LPPQAPAAPQPPAPGHPGGVSQPEHAVLSLAGFPTELGKNGAEISFFKLVPPQALHFSSLLSPGSWSTSKTLAQSLHLYSNIGISTPP
jgi:hypothetical protein